MGRLDDKVAIVTGAGQGIGRGIAIALAKEGAALVVVGRTQEKIDTVAKELRGLGARAIAALCDVSIEGQVKATVARAASEFGAVDILVNCAQGKRNVFAAQSIPEDEWDESFQTGVKATWYCCKAVLPHMKERGGKIINFGSAAGVSGATGLAHYSANKEAIRGFTRTAAREWGKHNINVNVICPLAASPAAKDFAQAIQKNLSAKAIQRVGDPEKDIGRVAVFLASDDSSYMTGQTFMVNGGVEMF